MKQRISPRQLRELSVQDQATLRHWWEPASGDSWVNNGDQDTQYVGVLSAPSLPAEALPLVSIGQMIDFLGDVQLHDDGASWVVVSDRRVYMPPGEGTELCDSLWEAMKGEIGTPKQLDVGLTTPPHGQG